MKRALRNIDGSDTTGYAIVIEYDSYTKRWGYRPYHDGWLQSIKLYTRLKDAASALFSGYSGGYELLYYFEDGGYLYGPLCHNCIRDNWLAGEIEKDDDIVVTDSDSDVKYEQEQMCESCGVVIVEQVCPECGDSIDTKTELGIFGSESYHVLHGTCLLKLLRKGKAQYMNDGYVVSDEWYRGTYTPLPKLTGCEHTAFEIAHELLAEVQEAQAEKEEIRALIENGDIDGAYRMLGVHGTYTTRGNDG